MDALDFEILREMGRNRVFLAGGAEPRLNAASIAERLGVDPTTVRDRLRAWEEDGFLLGYEVLPAPELFGARVEAASVRVSHEGGRSALVERLRGLPTAMAAIEHVGDWVGVGLLDEGRGADWSQVADLPSVAEVAPPFRVRSPAPTVQPSPLDWRILRAAHEQPRAGAGELAERVGIHRKTLARRYQALVEGRAVWFVPLLDFSAYSGAILARFFVTLSSDGRAADVVGALRGSVPELLEHATHPDLGLVELLLHLSSVGDLERATQVARRVPGVAGVEHVLPLRLHVFPTWFREALERAAPRP
jgi:DNA-binding Lrp family transcriptional regulator